MKEYDPEKNIPNFEMAVGDIDSNEMGSGARANGDKAKWDLMPLSQIGYLLHSEEVIQDILSRSSPASLMSDLGNFQAGYISGHQLLLAAVAYNWYVQAGPENITLMKSLENVIRVWNYGLEKYAPFNWAKGMPWSVPIACMCRHIQYDFEVLGSEHLSSDGMKVMPILNDLESEELHAAHIVCNAMMVCHYETHWVDGDDRPTHVFRKEE